MRASNLRPLVLMWPQDVFKESRPHDHLEAKNDMETHVRSRKLPLTRKIYAFYHAPIVKFWSNTVRETRARTQPSIMVVYQSGSAGTEGTGTGCFRPGSATWHGEFSCFEKKSSKKRGKEKFQKSGMSLPKGDWGKSSWAHHTVDESQHSWFLICECMNSGMLRGKNCLCLGFYSFSLNGF